MYVVRTLVMLSADAADADADAGPSVNELATNGLRVWPGLEKSIALICKAIDIGILS